jgi:hypothetical protein
MIPQQPRVPTIARVPLPIIFRISAGILTIGQLILFIASVFGHISSHHGNVIPVDELSQLSQQCPSSALSYTTCVRLNSFLGRSLGPTMVLLLASIANAFMTLPGVPKALHRPQLPASHSFVLLIIGALYFLVSILAIDAASSLSSAPELPSTSLSGPIVSSASSCTAAHWTWPLPWTIDECSGVYTIIKWFIILNWTSTLAFVALGVAWIRRGYIRLKRL